MIFTYTPEFHQRSKYFTIKINNLIGKNKNEIMIQINDASHYILFQNEKNQNDVLKTINATVNHEIRNPLNSIVAVNNQND